MRGAKRSAKNTAKNISLLVLCGLMGVLCAVNWLMGLNIAQMPADSTLRRLHDRFVGGAVGYEIRSSGVSAADPAQMALTVDGKLYGGVTNVGVKPTVGSDGPLAETYILDFSGDLYGKTVEVYFFRFVRPERRFESIDRLREQIAADKCSVQEEVAQNIEQMLFVDSLVQPD